MLSLLLGPLALSWLLSSRFAATKRPADFTEDQVSTSAQFGAWCVNRAGVVLHQSHAVFRFTMLQGSILDAAELRFLLGRIAG